MISLTSHAEFNYIHTDKSMMCLFSITQHKCFKCCVTHHNAPPESRKNTMKLAAMQHSLPVLSRHCIDIF